DARPLDAAVHRQGLEQPRKREDEPDLGALGEEAVGEDERPARRDVVGVVADELARVGILHLQREELTRLATTLVHDLDESTPLGRSPSTAPRGASRGSPPARSRLRGETPPWS